MTVAHRSEIDALHGKRLLRLWLDGLCRIFEHGRRGCISAPTRLRADAFFRAGRHGSWGDRVGAEGVRAMSVPLRESGESQTRSSGSENVSHLTGCTPHLELAGQVFDQQRQPG